MSQFKIGNIVQISKDYTGAFPQYRGKAGIVVSNNSAVTFSKFPIGIKFDNSDVIAFFDEKELELVSDTIDSRYINI